MTAGGMRRLRSGLATAHGISLRERKRTTNGTLVRLAFEPQTGSTPSAANGYHAWNLGVTASSLAVADTARNSVVLADTNPLSNGLITRWTTAKNVDLGVILAAFLSCQRHDLTTTQLSTARRSLALTKINSTTELELTDRTFALQVEAAKLSALLPRLRAGGFVRESIPCLQPRRFPLVVLGLRDIRDRLDNWDWGRRDQGRNFKDDLRTNRRYSRDLGNNRRYSRDYRDRRLFRRYHRENRKRLRLLLPLLGQRGHDQEGDKEDSEEESRPRHLGR